ncbi:hypothetical protein H310_09061, partial [Aphanomyces invadans]
MRAKKNLSDKDRRAIIQQLMAHLVDDKKLIHGALNKIALEFGVHRDVSSRIKGRSGRNLKHQNVAERMKAIPKASRTTFSFYRRSN